MDIHHLGAARIRAVRRAASLCVRAAERSVGANEFASGLLGTTAHHHVLAQAEFLPAAESPVFVVVHRICRAYVLWVCSRGLAGDVLRAAL